MKEIVIDISDDGEVRIETKGFKGKACLEESQFLKNLLGKETPEMKVSFLKLPLFILQVLLSYLLFGVFFARTRGLPADFMDSYRQLARQVDRDPSCQLTAAQHRLLWWSKLFDPAGNQVMFVNLSSLRYFISLGILEKLLAKWLPDLREGAASLLCSGTEEVLSAEMGRGIWNLAKTAKKEPRLKALFKKEKPENIMGANPTAANGRPRKSSCWKR